MGPARTGWLHAGAAGRVQCGSRKIGPNVEAAPRLTQTATGPGAASPSGERRPCITSADACSPLDPLPSGHRPLGVALSGGGVRATLTGLGALRLLSDVGRLGDIRHLTSVSGGSITAGMTAAIKWSELRDSGFTSAASTSTLLFRSLTFQVGPSNETCFGNHGWPSHRGWRGPIFSPAVSRHRSSGIRSWTSSPQAPGLRSMRRI